jgi:cytidylate kinase
MRDRLDTTRADSSLVKVPGAIAIDTDALDPAGVARATPLNTPGRPGT